MRQLLILLLTIGIFSTSKGQDSKKTPYDDFIKKFNSRFDTAAWLCGYDDIAWWTSDSVYASSKEEQALLGREWFCLKKKNTWHAIYGKYENSTFTTVFHYIVDSNNHISRSWENLDTLTLNSYSRALKSANERVSSYPDSPKVRFNQYVRQNDDKSISVWLLPAFTTNSIAVYGGEFYYLFDSLGINVLSKIEYSIGYKGFKPDTQKEIIIDYSSFEEPPLSAVFFAWYYRTYFERITISTKKFNSTPFKMDQRFTWLHAAKDK